jgi:hypothetical protein
VITDIIVSGTLVLSLAFLAVWLVSSNFRAWIEQPKYALERRMRSYDRRALDRDAHTARRSTSEGGDR